MESGKIIDNGGQSESSTVDKSPVSWQVDSLTTTEPIVDDVKGYLDQVQNGKQSPTNWTNETEETECTEPTTVDSGVQPSVEEWTGKTSLVWADSARNMEEILKAYMQNTNSRFTSWKTTKGFLKEITDIRKYKITFEDARVKTRPEQQIKYSGTPYIISGQKIYECEFGIDRNITTKKRLLDIKAVEMLRKLSGQEDQGVNNDAKVVRRRGPRFCKKFGCPVRIIIREAIFFPDYKAKGNTEKYKRKVTRALTEDWNAGKKIEMKRMILMPLPPAEMHQNHPSALDRKKRRRSRKKLYRNAETGQEIVGDKDHDVIGDNVDEDAENINDQFAMTVGGGGSLLRHVRIWSRCMMDLVRKLNNFHQPGSSKDLCRPLMVKNNQCGTIPFPVLDVLQNYQDTFPFVKDDKTGNIKYVTVNDQLITADQRTQAIDIIIKQFREKKLFVTLNGWRDEVYPVSSSFGGEIYFELERSATCLFGIHRYGVHVNGYVKNAQNEMFMWIGKRSEAKQTWPGKLDNTVGGGMAARMTVHGTLIKECIEEAAIPEELARQSRSAGTVSYMYEDERGVFPETQFVFDLEMPESFQPVNIDGEVDAFYLLTIEEVKTLIATDEFKPNSALVILDFLIRHGFIEPDTEPYYTEFVKGMHC